MDSVPPPGVSDPPFGRTRHPYFMHDMIRRQGVAARATYRAITEELQATPVPCPVRVLFTGIGTSFHAALAAGAAAHEALQGRCDVRVRSSFDLVDGPEPVDPERLTVVFSAEGETAFTLAAQRRLKEGGSPIVLITTRERSSSVELAGRVLVSQYATEAAWTHTVSYTAGLVAAGALLDHWTGTGPTGETSVEDEVSEAVTVALATETAMLELVDSVAPKDRILLLGSGAGDAIAREGALKLREGSGRFVATAGVEEVLHGVLPSVTDRTAVLGIATTPLQRARAVSALEAARTIGAVGFLLDASGAPNEEGVVSLPHLSRPIPAVLGSIPLQFLAYWIAVAEGRNPDVMGLDDPRMMKARRGFGI